SNGVFSNNYGVAATSLSLLGGSMRIDELQAGSINHAIDIGLVETKRNTYSWPAQRTDGWIDDADAISEGQRFRLDPTLNVVSRNGWICSGFLSSCCFTNSFCFGVPSRGNKWRRTFVWIIGRQGQRNNEQCCRHCIYADSQRLLADRHRRSRLQIWRCTGLWI